MSRDWLAFGAVVLATACAVESSDVPPEVTSPARGGTASGGIGGSARGGMATSPEQSPISGRGGAPANGGGSGGTASTSNTSSGSGGTSSAGTNSGMTSGWTFPTSSEGWSVSYAEPDTLKGSSSVSWDEGLGSPEAGSLKLSIPFSGADQKLEVSIAVNAMNMSGKTITAQVKLDSGLSTSAGNPGGAKLYVKTGDAYIYADSGWTNLDNNWVSLSLDASSPPGFIADPARYNSDDVREIGVEIATGSTGSFTSAIAHLDTVVY